MPGEDARIAEALADEIENAVNRAVLDASSPDVVGRSIGDRFKARSEIARAAVDRILAALRRPDDGRSDREGDGWLPIVSAPQDGEPLDLWMSDPSAPNGGYRETNARWAAPDHTCGEAGRYCDSCPPKGKQWCDDLGRYIEVDEEGEGERRITHWKRDSAPSTPVPQQQTEGAGDV